MHLCIYGNHILCVCFYLNCYAVRYFLNLINTYNFIICSRQFILPEAVQLTEIYEAAMRSGNSQFSLPAFQSYKLLYAMLLADLGK